MSYRIIPVTPFAQNSSLIWCDQTQHATLVDPGGNPEQIIQAIDECHVKLQFILLTHGHLDHVGAAPILAEHYQVPIIGPAPADQFWLDNIVQQQQMFGFGNIQAFLPQRWLADHEQITLGQLTFEVRTCPGHTPGHVVFIDHEHRLAWVGDVLFHQGIGRSDFPQGNYADLIHSIKTQLLTLDDDYRFIPGHGPESTIGEERAHNPFLR